MRDSSGRVKRHETQQHCKISGTDSLGEVADVDKPDNIAGC